MKQMGHHNVLYNRIAAGSKRQTELTSTTFDLYSIHIKNRGNKWHKMQAHVRLVSSKCLFITNFIQLF